LVALYAFMALCPMRSGPRSGKHLTVW
jgi:hypothetical protein